MLTVYVHSFGFKYGGAPEGAHGCGFVFDCRGLPNPFWDEALRGLTGLDAEIVAYFGQRGEMLEFARHAEALVRYTAVRYRELGRAQLGVSFGCTGGRHRSVYLAAWLGARLREAGFAVRTEHRDVGRAPQLQPEPGLPLREEVG